MASLWKLPVIYVCENNLYNEYTSYDETSRPARSPARAEAFGIPAEEVDGQDVLAVYEATARAVERARARRGAVFLVCATYRYHGHHVGDVDRAYYRSKDEEERWSARARPDRAAGGAARRRRGDRADPRARRGRGRRRRRVRARARPIPDPSEVTEPMSTPS